MTQTTDRQATLVTLTADIVAVHVSNNSVAVGDVALLIQNIHGALSGLGAPQAPTEVRPEPAVSIRSSVKPDYIVCLEDGKKLKMLKRHLMTHYQLTPEDYRAKWNLPSDYPMVAPSYAEKRRALAHKIGLGRKAAAKTPEPAPVANPAKAAKSAKAPAARRPRKKAGEASQPS